MFSKTLLTVCLAVLAEARFGQEQVPIQAISDVQGGAAGEAATIAGAAVSDLLGGANACDKLQRADEIVAKLGTGADAMQAAIGMVAAEKNFNNFVADKPTVCSDPTLPTTQALRGITPLIDPGVGGADVANALSEKTKANPLDAGGLSVADLLQQNGFSNFTAEDASGAAAAAGSASSSSTSSSSAAASSDAAVAAAANTSSSSSSSSSSTSNTTTTSSTTTNNNNNQNLDFGACTPTMKFAGGLNGRPADEFTFQATDPLVAKGQQEALNPNIITNRICDQLTNVCDAADDAKAACEDAKAQIEALGTRDQSTADAWNEALGFGGAAGAARKMVVRARGVRRAGRAGRRGGVRA
ncbi:uncharacterized protein BKCO1_2400029 [Diplodia corticola]|uniref:Circumsporozoite protein n=1 Tax=Diplodia corticola TaxID=236234 RepID=A0A1J9R237_9PEZI|nr:uncharacterized protein BKCO1_2400029 [Diplodia corticola]OJD34306.1 hypothetical protein BKCO1_2400029 [Diplodia corticola]